MNINDFSSLRRDMLKCVPDVRIVKGIRSDVVMRLINPAVERREAT